MCNQFPRSRFKNGFTLIELILSIVILGIVVTLGIRFTIYAVEAKRYKETINTLIMIKRSLIGDERLHNLGTPVFGGYCERYGMFPPAAAQGSIPVALKDYLPPQPTTSSHDPYLKDGWGHLLEYKDTADITYVTDGSAAYKGIIIKSFGRDGKDDTSTSPPTVFDADVHIAFRRDLYMSNTIVANVMDMNGTILRGAHDPVLSPINTHHIYLMTAAHNSNAATRTVSTNPPGATATIGYERGFFMITKPGTAGADGNPAGLYYDFLIYPTNGGGNAQGVYDHRNDLTGNVTHVRYCVPIFPKGADNYNFLQFRLPGATDISEAP